ncbi:MAG: hypothetical protein A2041_01875 [Bacteroidetes bacterium GWA2_31_9b]|nr:MAG: hypothetical protein A2041_01875 [Bacteroidetes bacterium GWA2_31_9b]
MKQKILLLLLFVIIPFIQYAQNNDTIFNQTDKNGLKQGFWKKSYPNGKIQYTGKFVNNNPVGEFIRYTPEGYLLVKMNYKTGSDKIFSIFYYPNKNKQAEGYYIGKLKDSIWNYYSEEGTLLNCVPFLSDIKTGTEIKYYNTGKVFEKFEWINGLEDGKHLRYYENGNVMIRSTYVNGILNGIYASYTIDNKPIITGVYKNNLRDGIWIIYDETGREKQRINYIDGVAENQEELDKLEQYEIDQLEKNKGLYSDPSEETYKNNPPM